MISGDDFKDSVYDRFCKGTSDYPPAILFYGVNAPTTAQKKQEQRCIVICEELYSLSNTLLGEMRSSWNEVLILDSFKKNIKENYVINKMAIFAAYLDIVHNKYERMCKKEPILKEYYTKLITSSLESSNSEFCIEKKLASDNKKLILSGVFDMLCSALSHVDKSEIAEQYKLAFKEQSAKIKERFKENR